MRGPPSILKSWKEQHWQPPLLYEDPTHEQTLLELRTISLLPQDSVRNLQRQFGSTFESLSELQHITLITAETEGFVSHARLKSLSSDHPHDISQVLAGLVRDGYLEKVGATRASIYFVSGTHSIQLFTQDPVASSPDLNPSSPDLNPSSPDLNPLLASVLATWGYTKMPGKLSANKMRELIITLCNNQWLSLNLLSSLLERVNVRLGHRE